MKNTLIAAMAASLAASMFPGGMAFSESTRLRKTGNATPPRRRKLRADRDDPPRRFPGAKLLRKARAGRLGLSTLR